MLAFTVLAALLSLIFLLAVPPVSTSAQQEVPPENETETETEPLPIECEDNGYCDTIELQDEPTAIDWRNAEEVYITTIDGAILLVNVVTGEQREVANGLVMPQGLVTLNGRVFVSELNDLCELIPEFDASWGDPGRCRSLWREREKIVELFPEVDARVLSYVIQEDGSLGPPETVVDHLPTIDRDHSPNGMTNDGEFIYLSIGNPQASDNGWIYEEGEGGLEELEEAGVRTDFFGSVIRFRPDGSDVSVWATGFRNMYGISFGPDGTLYVADNNNGTQLEELNAIRQGGYYGFPIYPTHQAPDDAGVTEPLTVIDGNGSAGIYANEDGVYLGYRLEEADQIVVARFNYGVWEPQPVFYASDWVTGITERDGMLFILDFDDALHIIRPQEGEVIEPDSES